MIDVMELRQPCFVFPVGKSLTAIYSALRNH